MPGLFAENVCSDDVDKTVLAQMAATMDRALNEYPSYRNKMTGNQHSTPLQCKLQLKDLEVDVRNYFMT